MFLLARSKYLRIIAVQPEKYENVSSTPICPNANAKHGFKEF